MMFFVSESFPSTVDITLMCFLFFFDLTTKYNISYLFFLEKEKMIENLKH